MSNALDSIASALKDMCLTLSGGMDCRPCFDARGLLLDLGRGEWLECVLDGRCIYPFVGDLEKGKALARFAKFIEQLAGDQAALASAADLLPAIFSRLDHLLRLMPPDAPGSLAELRAGIRSLMRQNHIASGPSKRLADVAHRFVYKPRWREGSIEYEQIGGRLGVPGTVVKHRDVSAQREISSGTGDHAGHRIGIRFGAPGDSRNMALQNANINTRAPRVFHETFRGSGGSYLDLEDRWEALLLEGVGVIATVKDRYKLGEERPFSRYVSWTTVNLKGARHEEHLEFLNSGSPQQRAAAALAHP